MGCSAAKSLEEYKATLPITSVAELNQGFSFEAPVSVADLAKASAIQPVNPQGTGDGSTQQQKLRSKVVLPKLAFLTELSNAKLKTPIRLNSTERENDSFASHPSIPRRNRIELPKNILNFRLSSKEGSRKSSLKPYLTLEEARSGSRKRNQAKNSCLAYCQPINVNGQKYIKKSTHKTLINSLSKVDHKQDTKNKSLLPDPKKIVMLPFKLSIENCESTLNNSKLIPRKPDNLELQGEDSKQKEEIDKFDPRPSTRGSMRNLGKVVLPNAEGRSRVSLNIHSEQSKSTRVPPIRIDSFEKKRPSMALTPETRQPTEKGVDPAKMKFKHAKTFEGSFAEQFRQTRLSIRGSQRQHRNERLFSPQNKLIPNLIQGKGNNSLTKYQNLELSEAETLEVKPAMTTAITSISHSKWYYIGTNLKNRLKY